MESCEQSILPLVCSLDQSVVCTLTAFIPYIYFTSFIICRRSAAGGEVSVRPAGPLHWGLTRRFLYKFKSDESYFSSPERDASLSSLVATIAYFFKCARSPCETCTILLPCNVFVQKLNS